MPEDQQGQSVTSSHSNQQRFFTNIYTYILDLAHAAAVAVLARLGPFYICWFLVILQLAAASPLKVVQVQKPSKETKNISGAPVAAAAVRVVVSKQVMKPRFAVELDGLNCFETLVPRWWYHEAHTRAASCVPSDLLIFWSLFLRGYIIFVQIFYELDPFARAIMYFLSLKWYV